MHGHGHFGDLTARRLERDILEQDHARRDDTHEDFIAPPAVKGRGVVLRAKGDGVDRVRLGHLQNVLEGIEANARKFRVAH